MTPTQALRLAAQVGEALEAVPPTALTTLGLSTRDREAVEELIRHWQSVDYLADQMQRRDRK